MKSFLQRARQRAGGQRKKITFVMGNQASDLDSMVAAVVYSFFLQSVSKVDDATFSPLINIPRKHFGLRGEAAGTFAGAGIDANMLPFVDDLDLRTLCEKKHANVVLVDHNKLANSQSFLAPYVVGIIDHHKDDQQYVSSCKFRQIETVGSCCSLVAHQVLKEAPEILTQEIATLLTSAILLDTSNMDPNIAKGTAKDKDALEQLEKAGGIKSNGYSRLYSKLMEERMDISNLSSAELLIKDTKYGGISEKRFAIASIPLRLKDWIDKDSKLLESWAQFSLEENLDALIVMTSFTMEEKNFCRELVIFGINTPPQDKKDKEMWILPSIESGLLDSEEKLDLEKLKILDSSIKDLSSKYPKVFLAAYKQRNIKASRKQIMPLIEKLTRQTRDASL
mmetsp:Transcript_18718/g.29741  ORF Transcript_18718/g.29741 Transcript_18718/m.29741 type:complete len:394 (-) Transcript_18718:86-1267(-)